MWWIILWIVIGLSLILSACGDGSPVTLQPPQPQVPAVQRVETPTSSLIDVPLPGFIPRQVNLIEREIFSTKIPILSSNYAIAWTGSFTEGRILAQSRSDKPITLDPCTITAAGEHTLLASAYSPLDFLLLFPLAEGDVSITIDPGCGFRIDYELIPQQPIPTPQPPAEPCEGSPSPPTEPQEPGFEHGIPYRLVIKLFDGQTDAEITDLRDFEFAVDPKNEDSVVMGGSGTTWTVQLTRDLGTLELEIKVSNRETEQTETAPVKREDVCDNRAMDPPDCFEEDEDEEGDCDPPPPPPPCEGDCPPPPPPPPVPPAPPPPPPPPPPPCRGNCGSSTGDPHYVTLDGLYYDFQGAGEYTLIRSEDGQFVVQTRMEPFGRSDRVTVNTAVATQVAQHRVNIFLPNILVIDEEIIEPQTSEVILDGGRLTRYPGDSIVISWETGDFVVVTNNRSHINVRVQPNPGRAGQVSGLLGDFNGDSKDDIRARSGELFASNPIRFEELYQGFGNSWRVSPTESLFDYAPGESLATFTDLNFPRGTIELTPEQEQSAEAICRAKGIRDELLLRACVIDVAVTGQADFADGFTEIEPPQEGLEVESTFDLSGIDPGLLGAIRVAVRKPTGPIEESDLQNVRSLDVRNVGVRSLVGMPNLPNMEALYIAGAPLQNFDGMRDFPRLRFMTLSGFQSFDGMPAISNLNQLTIRSNSLLQGMPLFPNLEMLSIQNSTLVNLDGLPNLPNLKHLRFENNEQLSTLAGMPVEMTTLETFNISASLPFPRTNQLKDLRGMARMPNLTSLSFTGQMGLISLEGMPELPKLDRFSLTYNRALRSFTGMPQLDSLTQLNLSDNSIRNFSTLPNLPQLRSLSISYEPINDLQGIPEKMPSLFSLSLSATCLATPPDLPGISVRFEGPLLSQVTSRGVLYRPNACS